MELRTYLEILRRRRAVIIAAMLIVALVAGIVSSLKTPLYTATAQVLLRPNDPSEQINQTNQFNRQSADADRYVSAQLDIVEGEAVAQAALEDVKGVTAKQLRDGVHASQSGATDIIKVSAVDPDPARAAKMANAVASSYIENRRQTAVDGLQKASDQLQSKLDELEQRISDLDNEIDTETSAQTKAHQKELAKRPVAITQPVTQPDGSVVQVPVTQAQVDDNFTPNDDEALSAARYAAAVQYQSLYGQQQNLLVTKSLKKGEAELITKAEVPTAPSSPRPKRDTALGLLVGLLLGLGIAFLREQLDDKIRSRADAEELTKLPVIAELPFDAMKNQSEIAAHERPLGVLAESARGLRTSLTFLGVDGPLRRIVVTSSEPGDGKSYVAANLAAVYAQAGMRTVLVSADLRRPGLDSLFPKVVAGPGLAEVITSIGAPKPSSNGNSWLPVVDGVADGILAKALRPTHIEGLSLLPAGQLPPNPAEILGSDKALKLLEALSGLADVVIIDTPPVLAVTDAAVLAPNADGVILVAAADQTHRGALTHAVGTLGSAHARMLGVVLNKVEASSGGGYGYRGRYYGAYYGHDGDEKRGRFSRKGKRQEPKAGSKADPKVEVVG